MTDMAVTRGAQGRATAASRRALGAYGEELAARHLHGLGYAVLERNWRCEIGEVDLVCRDGSTLVVCEVKTRSSVVSGTPHEAITDAKLDRLKRLGARWASDRGIRPDGIRIDLVAIIVPRRGAPSIDHVRGLF